jgi:hypothetical protein
MPICNEFGCDLDHVLWRMPIQQVFKKLFYLKRLNSNKPVQTKSVEDAQKQLLRELQLKNRDQDA